ncbi:MAG TPA: hypothetical protein VEZ20_02495 [Allosphingosinicella sp.]|nr:hypothetical protein [Allosphingosinicella sp.]
MRPDIQRSGERAMASVVKGQAKPRLYLSAGWWAAALLLLSVVAFWPNYVTKLPFEAELFVHLHAAGVVLWMAMLIAQPWLIGRGKRPLHKKIGRISYVLVPYIVVSSLLLAHQRTSALAPAQFEEFGHSLYLPFGAVLTFAAAWGLAIAYRREPFLHGRYMVGTVFSLVDPVVARLLMFYTSLKPDDTTYALIGFGIADLTILLLLWLDRKEPRGRTAWLVLLPLYLVVHIGWFTLARTDAWLALCRGFVALPLT